MDILERAMTAMPQVVEASGRDLLDGILVEEAGYSQRAGYQSIGIICKNAVESQALYDRLREKINLIG